MNPFMSMWLSGANAVANRARGQAMAAAKRQAAALAKETAGGAFPRRQGVRAVQEGGRRTNRRASGFFYWRPRRG